MIIVKAPFRISLFGGGTDFPEWFMENGGYVISTTIDKYCYIMLRYLPPFFDYKYRFRYSTREEVNNIKDIKHPAIKARLKQLGIKEGIEIVHSSDIPAQSGMGSSSAFCASLIKGLDILTKKNHFNHPMHLSAETIYFERCIMQENTGWQDQIAIAHGGVNEIKFSNNGYSIHKIHFNGDLEDCLMLFFTGFVRNSSEIQKKFLENMNRRKSELYEIFQIAIEGAKILRNKNKPGKKNINDLGKLLHESWKLKRTLSNVITNQSIDHHYDEALKAGAIGGKLLGAGGGGFLLFLVELEKQDHVKKALKKLLHVPFNLEYKGCHIL